MAPLRLEGKLLTEAIKSACLNTSFSAMDYAFRLMGCSVSRILTFKLNGHLSALQLVLKTRVFLRGSAFLLRCQICFLHSKSIVSHQNEKYDLQDVLFMVAPLNCQVKPNCIYTAQNYK